MCFEFVVNVGSKVMREGGSDVGNDVGPFFTL